MSDRRHDLVVFGATGFVGTLLASYLAEHAPAHLGIALAGRRPGRLEATRGALGPRAADWPLVVADAADEPALRALAASARVVVTTVGPYSRYGMPLVRACSAEGTDYADLTGEVLFVRDAIDQCEQTARRTGARVVTSCGFDSVPSDLGVLLLHERAAADGAGGLLDTTLLVRRLKGGVSGGTIDSARAQVEALGARPELKEVVFDPFALSPDRASEPRLKGQRDPLSVFRDAQTGQWVGPFAMASYNTRVVQRSNALLQHAYGDRFRYRELTAYGSDAMGLGRAAALSGALGLGLAAMAFAPTRPLIDRLLPAPGDGPSPDQREAGSFRLEIRTRTTSGRRYLAVVAAKGDPGYAATAVMLGESALCLVEDERRGGGGLLTPAVAMGDSLVKRLRAQGFTMSVTEL